MNIDFLKPGYTFQINAILYSELSVKEHFNDFEIVPESARMYGHKPEDIKVVTLMISENQEKKFKKDKSEPDYWSYFDFKDNCFGMTYPRLVLLDVCFYEGLIANEALGKGKAFRCEVVKYENLIK